MANEIAVGTQDARGIETTMYIELDAGKIKQVGGVNVVETPAASLPAWAGGTYSVAQLDKLNDGLAVFARVRVPVLSGDTTPQLVARAQSLYADTLASVQEQYDMKYQFIGTSLGAV